MPRQIAMYLSKSLTNASLPEIGRSFGGKASLDVITRSRRSKSCEKGITISTPDHVLSSNIQVNPQESTAHQKHRLWKIFRLQIRTGSEPLTRRQTAEVDRA
jgi:hypothetical protein